MSLGKFKAKQILSELYIDDPRILQDHLKDICLARGAFVREGTVENADARLTVSGNKGIITVNPAERYTTRTRFSIAHELGHFELHRNRAPDLTCDEKALNDWALRERVKSLEAEANEFASELLMPEEFIKDAISSARPSITLLETLARQFGTSLYATARRFIELTPEACAIVFFKKGFIWWVWPSKFFRQQGYDVPLGRLDSHSYAFDAVTGKPVPRQMLSVDASTWLRTPYWLEDEPILEESRFFPSLGSGISLLWIHSSRLIRH